MSEKARDIVDGVRPHSGIATGSLIVNPSDAEDGGHLRTCESGGNCVKGKVELETKGLAKTGCGAAA